MSLASLSTGTVEEGKGIELVGGEREGEGCGDEGVMERPVVLTLARETVQVGEDLRNL